MTLTFFSSITHSKLIGGEKPAFLAFLGSVNVGEDVVDVDTGHKREQENGVGGVVGIEAILWVGGAAAERAEQELEGR